MDAQPRPFPVTDGHAVGVALRVARRRMGLSQRDLAAALGWRRSKVGRWECGDVPQGFDEVVALLRVLGFGVELTDLEASRWTDWDDPAEHVADRGERRFPAHLELCEEDTSTTWNWTRHRGEPSPLAGLTSFRRRTQARAVADVRQRQAEQDAVRARRQNGSGRPPTRAS